MKHTFRYLIEAPPDPGALLELSAGDSRHVARVVRRRIGDPVELIDGTGRIWPAAVAGLGPPVTVVVGEPRRAVAPAGVTLYMGLCEWGRLDLVVEKAAELGIPRLVVHTSQRAKRVPDPDTWRRRRDRFARVAEAAARQSGQGYLPRVQGLVPFGHVLEEVPSTEGYLIDPRGDVPLPEALAAVPRQERLSLAIGPDAGFTEDEVRAAREAGWRVCTLGPSILRAETAALVALSLGLEATGRFHQAAPGGETGDDGAVAVPAREGRGASATP